MNSDKILKEPVYSPLVLEFLVVAQKYCLFVEEVHKYNKEQLFDYLHRICPLLYIRGSVLPKIEIDNSDVMERYVTEEQWETVFNEIRSIIGKNDEYWFIENDSPTNDTVKGSLSENLADIYQDMKDFIILYQKPLRDAKKAAVYEIRALFQSHWGYRIVNILKTLHYLIYKDKVSEQKAVGSLQ